MKNVHILKNANHVRALPHSTILYLVNLDTLYPPRDAIRLHWVLIHFLDLPNQKLDAGSFFLSRSAAENTAKYLIGNKWLIRQYIDATVSFRIREGSASLDFVGTAGLCK